MKKALKIAGCVLLALVILVLGYVAYVFLDYHRIEDNLTLTAQGTAASSAQTGVPYTVVSYNIGFGAYEDDYSFFMDGGTESWAWSKERLDENLSLIAQTLKDQMADYYFIQEVDTDSTRSYPAPGANGVQLRLGAELRLPLPVLASDPAPRLLRFRTDDLFLCAHCLLPAAKSAH